MRASNMDFETQNSVEKAPSRCVVSKQESICDQMTGTKPVTWRHAKMTLMRRYKKKFMATKGII